MPRTFARCCLFLALAAFFAPSSHSQTPTLPVSEAVSSPQGAILLIDTRSQAEWEVLRLPGSHSLPGFSITEGDLLDLRGRETPSPKMVFVGNSTTDAVVQEAAARAAKWKFGSIYVLSGGVAEWTQTQPGKTLLFGLPLDSPEAKAQRLRREDIDAVMMAPNVFLEAARSRKFTVIDIRTPGQRVKRDLLPEPVLRLSPDELVWSLKKQSIPATRLLIADYDGQLLVTIQHYLSRYNVTEYRCLRGGLMALQNQGQTPPAATPAPTPAAATAPARPTPAPSQAVIPLPLTPTPR